MPQQQDSASASGSQQPQPSGAWRTKREELLALAARSRPTGRLAQATLLASAGVAGGAGHVSSSLAALREAETLEEC